MSGYGKWAAEYEEKNGSVPGDTLLFGHAAWTAAKAEPPADNSAMVPCKDHRPGGLCNITGETWICREGPCMIARHQ